MSDVCVRCVFVCVCAVMASWPLEAITHTTHSLWMAGARPHRPSLTGPAAANAASCACRRVTFAPPLNFALGALAFVARSQCLHSSCRLASCQQTAAGPSAVSSFTADMVRRAGYCSPFSARDRHAPLTPPRGYSKGTAKLLAARCSSACVHGGRGGWYNRSNEYILQGMDGGRRARTGVRGCELSDGGGRARGRERVSKRGPFGLACGASTGARL